MLWDTEIGFRVNASAPVMPAYTPVMLWDTEIGFRVNFCRKDAEEVVKGCVTWGATMPLAGASRAHPLWRSAKMGG